MRISDWSSDVCSSDLSAHLTMGMMAGPANTLPMMSGQGPHGSVEMGGMFTVLKVRDALVGDRDPGWYQAAHGEIARRVSTDPEFAIGRESCRERVGQYV